MLALDNLGLYRSGEASGPTIELDDSSDIGAHFGPCINLTWAQLHLFQQFPSVKPAIALKHNAVDDGVFDDPDQQRCALTLNNHVGEQAGRKQSLQAGVDAFWVERITSPYHQIGGHRRGFNTLVANNSDTVNSSLWLWSGLFSRCFLTRRALRQCGS